jgi:molybdenum cofactor synthesis domain-containing protein
MPLRPDRMIVTIAEARAILASSGTAITRTEVVGLHDLSGRVLAEDVIAALDVPPFARAAMDGYAVVSADTHGAQENAPVTLALVDAIYTGDAPGHRVASGQCIAIATGAPLPEGADAVVMIEQTMRKGESVAIRTTVRVGQNIGMRGSDVRAGQRVLAAGTFLTAAQLGVIAAIGLPSARVYTRPRVAILCTGNEVVAPGQPLGAGRIYDVNTATLAAVVRQHGGQPVPYLPVADDRAAIADAFEAALPADMVLVSGGSSVGERDYILEMMEARGAVLFQGIAIKPGKPTIFSVASGRPVFGMPGNPTSCLSNAYLLVAPLLRRIARLPPQPDSVVQARLARTVASPAGRHQFYPVRLEGNDAIPAFKGSGDITSLAGADGYFEIAERVEQVEAGTLVDVRRF